MIKTAFVAKVGNGYRIVVPQHIRDKIGLRVGEYLGLEITARGASLEEALIEMTLGSKDKEVKEK
jgi:bifunctional DNA-binding transcriptional regulator/antitoxin component of YhaV-PrlF toxin-antitoxin module